ncbi:MAG: hypothetical protein EBS34_12915, partial [Flavobacteriales bacterium]|nr:hypothetical protein [Flavobacteriales bacterium]
MEDNKVWFLSFASENHYKTLNRIKNEAEALGLFDNIVIVREHDLKTSDDHRDFWNQHTHFITN